MDDTDNDLSDGELGSEAEEDSGGLVRLPCDQPWWPEVSQVLAQLATSTHIEATVNSVGKLAEIVHGEGPGDALRHFLEAECGDEERGLGSGRHPPRHGQPRPRAAQPQALPGRDAASARGV